MGLTNTNEYKAIVVGVDKDTNDIIDPVKGLYVYDLSTPCPPICDTASVMYKAYGNANLVQ